MKTILDSGKAVVGERGLNLNPRFQEAMVMDDKRLAGADYGCRKRIYMLCCVDVSCVGSQRPPGGMPRRPTYRTPTGVLFGF